MRQAQTLNLRAALEDPRAVTAPRIDAFIQKWHELFERGDPERLLPLIHNEVEFYSPAIFAPKRGRRTVFELLRVVYTVFENYRVTDTWVKENRVMLEFEAEVGKYTLQGIDRFALDPEGKVIQLKVWLRPLTGVKELARRVADTELDEYLATRGTAERGIIRARVRATRIIEGIRDGFR